MVPQREEVRQPNRKVTLLLPRGTYRSRSSEWSPSRAERSPWADEREIIAWGLWGIWVCGAGIRTGDKEKGLQRSRGLTDPLEAGWILNCVWVRLVSKKPAKIASGTKTATRELYWTTARTPQGQAGVTPANTQGYLVTTGPGNTMSRTEYPG